jgi:tetratricopeptide (TPR) repeat protein
LVDEEIDMHKRSMLLLSAAILAAGCAKDPNAEQMADAKRIQDAQAKLDEQSRKPISADTRFAAGQLAESQGEIPNALTQYQAALKLDPKHAPTLFRLGVLYTSQRRFDEAITAWNRYVAATNNAAAGYSNLGFCYELAHRPEDAEAAYRKGIAKDPQNGPCRINYGLMLARQNKIAEATEQFSAVLRPAEVHYNLASVYETQGRKLEARAEYRQALNLEPNMSDAKARLASLD